MCIPPTLLSACLLLTYLITVLSSVSLVANAASIAITESTTWGTRTSCTEEGQIHGGVAESRLLCKAVPRISQAGLEGEQWWTECNHAMDYLNYWARLNKDTHSYVKHATRKFWEPKNVCRNFTDWHWTTKSHRFALKCYSGTQGATGQVDIKVCRYRGWDFHGYTSLLCGPGEGTCHYKVLLTTSSPTHPWNW